MGIIYKATNILNNKVYIGQTNKSFEIRKYFHIKHSKIKKNKFYNAIRKYGIDNFKWEVINSDVPIEMLNDVEMNTIILYDSYKNGYNSTLGGEGNRGYIFTFDDKLKMSKSHIGKPSGKKGKTGYTAWNKGLKKDTDSRVEKYSKSYKENYSKENHPNFGKKFSEELK